MQKKTFDFEIKEDSNIKAVEIQGFANKATADRIGDLIEPKAWDLENFKNNPIIFFNHDRNLPIGKAIESNVDDDGLSIKVRISKSKEAPIPMIRDLISEGILKTFSVGFDDHGSSFEDKSDGLTKFEKAELLEVSVVTIPMNQDSLFSVSKDGQAYKVKSFESTVDQWKTKSYGEIKKECLELSGHLVAAAVNDAIEEAEEHVKDFAKFHLNQDMLKGHELPDDQFIDSASFLFNIDKSSLLDLRAKESGEMEEEEEEEEKTSDEEVKPEEEKAESSEDEPNKDFNECVSSKIPKLIAEGKERDDAVAIAIQACQDSKSCEISQEDFAHFIAVAEKASEPEKAESEAEAEVKEATPADGAPIAESPDFDSRSIFPEGQPGIELQKAQLAMAGSFVTNQKQTNSILGEVVNLLKTIESRLAKDSTALETTEQAAPEPAPAQLQQEDDTEEVKKLENHLREIEKLHKKIDILMK
jgi:HK97 family phage prohead protease